MQGQEQERWELLCAQATVEQDPEKLMQLIEEINLILAAKEERLLEQRANTAGQ